MDAREHDRRRRGPKVDDPEKHRAIESLKLARADMARQQEATTHPIRKEQITAALKEIDKQLAKM
jgi:hypothetical protein